MSPVPRHEGIKTGYESGIRGASEIRRDLEDSLYDYDASQPSEPQVARMKVLFDEAVAEGITIDPVLNSLFATQPELYKRMLETSSPEA